MIPFETLLRECGTANGNQLLATLLASHPLSYHGYSLSNAHKDS
jgi:hypothetical protein